LLAREISRGCGGNGRDAIERHLDVRILADITPLTA